MELIELEDIIKSLLFFRLRNYNYNLVVVGAYYAMDRTVMCRIELFEEQWIVESRIAKYEAEIKEGFYHEAEKQLIGQLTKKIVARAI